MTSIACSRTPNVARHRRCLSAGHDRVRPTIIVTHQIDRSMLPHARQRSRRHHAQPPYLATDRGRQPSNPLRAALDPIAHGRGQPCHCLPAVSSPEASRTPAARHAAPSVSRQASENP